MKKDEKPSILKSFGSGLTKIAALAGKLLLWLCSGVLFIITGTASIILLIKYKKETSKA